MTRTNKPLLRPTRPNRPLVLKKVSVAADPVHVPLYLLGYLDRVNLGFAAVADDRDLISAKAFMDLAQGSFSSAIFSSKCRATCCWSDARIWIARIMITWGICRRRHVAGARARSVFIQLAISCWASPKRAFSRHGALPRYWFPPAHRARATALFFTSTAVAGAIGGPISGWLLSLSGVAGLRGWQWLFLMEGVPSILVGEIRVFFLTDRPEHAKWG